MYKVASKLNPFKLLTFSLVLIADKKPISGFWEKVVRRPWGRS